MVMADRLNLYRRIFASLDSVETAWWYFGTSSVILPDSLEVIVNHVETVMIYRSVDRDADGFSMPWWEIGVFRDAATGELPRDWLNPVTGVSVKAPQSFEEGPAAYQVYRDGKGVAVSGVQSYARSLGTSVSFEQAGPRLRLTQIERKIRAFPGQDNAIPDHSSPDAVQTETCLQVYADQSDLADSTPAVAASGFYQFSMSSAPAWLGFGDLPARFVVRGIMQKMQPGAVPNPTALARMQQVFPHRFKSFSLSPNWE